MNRINVSSHSTVVETVESFVLDLVASTYMHPLSAFPLARKVQLNTWAQWSVKKCRFKTH